jgi:hypothetical protein
VPLPFGCPLYASSGVGKFSPNSRGNDGVKLRKPSDNVAAIVEPSRQRLPGLSGSGIAARAASEPIGQQKKPAVGQFGSGSHLNPKR